MNKKELDLIIENAVNLRIAALKANDKEIYRYNDYDDSFLISEKLFAEMFKDKKCEILDRESNKYKLKYKGVIDGLTFYTITDDLLFNNDEKLEAEEI